MKRKRPLLWRYQEMWRIRTWPWELTVQQQDNLKHGIRIDFELPYPYPLNEHEDGMNMACVFAELGTPVVSGRADLVTKEQRKILQRYEACGNCFFGTFDHGSGDGRLEECIPCDPSQPPHRFCTCVLCKGSGIAKGGEKRFRRAAIAFLAEDDSAFSAENNSAEGKSA